MDTVALEELTWKWGRDLPAVAGMSSGRTWQGSPGDSPGGRPVGTLPAGVSSA